MKCALIGYGYWGKILEKYIHKSDFFQLNYIYAPSFKNITLQQILKDTEIECVFLATPTETHFNLVKECLRHKKHVFCEKPLVKTKEEMIFLWKLAEENQCCLYTDYIYCTSKAIQFLKQNLTIIGEIKYIEASIQQFGKFYLKDNVHDILGVHMLSAILYILNDMEEPVNFQVDKVLSMKENNSKQIVDAKIYFHINEKIWGELRNNLVSERKERILELDGEKGTLKFNMLSKDTIQYFQISFSEDEPQLQEKNYYFDETNNLNFSLEEFYHHIKNKKTENFILSSHVTSILETIHSMEEKMGNEH